VRQRASGLRSSAAATFLRMRVSVRLFGACVYAVLLVAASPGCRGDASESGAAMGDFMTPAPSAPQGEGVSPPAGRCAQPGEACRGANCCAGATCVNERATGQILCAALCVAHGDCRSGCCVPVGNTTLRACAPPAGCANSTGESGDGSLACARAPGGACSSASGCCPGESCIGGVCASACTGNFGCASGCCSGAGGGRGTCARPCPATRPRLPIGPREHEGVRGRPMTRARAQRTRDG
jgi:hypothetical protein